MPALTLDTLSSYRYTELRDEGPQNLDPIFARDRASQTVLRNVMETLVYPHPTQRDSYLPLLATGWRISEDGRTYTFSLRRGVRFSNGNPLSPEDAAYSLQRLILTSPVGGPQHLLLEPLLGYNAPSTGATTEVITTTGAVMTSTVRPLDIISAIDNGLYVGDRTALLANVPANTLLALCQDIQSAIVANESDGTLTIQLDRPWAPFLSIMSQTWTSIVDSEWAIERGAWDGRCETWQNYYAQSAEASALSQIVLGTGPYMLDYWTPGADYLLLANNDYWRRESLMWEGGPSGAPALSSVLVRRIPDPNERWQLLESGAAQLAMLSAAGSLFADRQTARICSWLQDSCEETDDANDPMIRVEDLPQGQQQALFFNFDIANADNAYLGSGELDGEGIPPDFFTDIHARRAFAYCLNRRDFIEAGLGGEGIALPSLLPPLPGETVQQRPIFPYRLRLCSQELSLAWEGRLSENGFRLQLPFESGNAAQQAAAVLLQNSLRAVNAAFRVEPVGLPSALLQQAVRERRAPLALFTWTPQLPDAYYVLAPAFSGEFAAFQRQPEELHEIAQDQLAQLYEARDLSSRPQVYAMLNQFYETHAPFVMLPAPAMTLFHRREVSRWLFNASDPLPYFYAFR